MRAANGVTTAALCLGAALAGCSSEPRRYSEQAGGLVEVPARFAQVPERAESATAVCSDFGIPGLEPLVHQALAENFELRQRWARLREADAAARAAGAARWPTLEAQAGASRSEVVGEADAEGIGTRPPGEEQAASLTAGNRYHVSLAAAYEVDLWGRLSAQSRAALLEREASAADLHTLGLSLSANVAGAWTRLLAQRQQLELLEEQERVLSDFLKLVETRFAQGQAGALDLTQQQQELEAIQARLARARGEQATTRHRLAVLLGRPVPTFEPPPEIAIEVSQAQLRRYNLTLDEIARRVAAGSVDLGGGGLDTPRGEVLVRTREEAERGEEFRQIVVIAGADGTLVRLGDIATVVDGFRDTDEAAYFNGERAVRVNVFRVGEQSPLTIAAQVKAYREEFAQRLPPTVRLAVWEDRSTLYADRIGLLLENGRLGVLLVLVLLGLFLAPRLAFWVTLGIPISFLGAFLFMPAFGVSINMISLFAFLLVLGIVVDDAIVVGESVYRRRQLGMAPLDASIAGAREVAVPVVFAVMTTMVAFTPMLFVPGVMGEFFINIPLIVLPILALSLVESLFILPAHLAHVGRPKQDGRGPLGWIRRLQRRIAERLEGFIEGRFRPFLERVLAFPALTLAIAFALLIVFAGLVAGGRIDFVFMPEIEGDTVTASIELPFGAPVSDTRRIALEVSEKAEQVAERTGDDGLLKGVYMAIGSLGPGSGPGGYGGEDLGGHVAHVTVELVPAAEREIGSAEFSRRWREAVGEFAGVERLAFNYNVGPAAGAAVAIELAHDDIQVLRRAAGQLAASLRDYAGVFDVDDGFESGKEQLDVALLPGARSLGITAEELARQLRGAFFGVEAERQQRGRDELRVYVRLPREARASEYAVENFVVRTGRGGEIPLEQAARIERGVSDTSIEREQGRRVVTVGADVDPGVTTGAEVTSALKEDVLPRLTEAFPQLTWEVSGEQQERAESLGALYRGFALALFVMYAMMAVVFRSYMQPALVMLAIPFGLIGAVTGHLLLGFDLSLVSVFGLIALAGVVVNDSLVMIAAVDGYREEGMDVREALIAGGMRRFRPVLLTSLTTFFGLAPMIFETSVQARFLIPMALSLGFGVLFVTLIALVVVPAAYLLAERARVSLGMS